VSISWSIVITTRDRAKMLQRAITSCVRQTFPCEVVVIDEASTDETRAVVDAFSTVRYFRNDVAIGHSAAANMGIKSATGSWIKPLDDDDWLAPDCIEVMTRFLSNARAHGLSPTLLTGRVVNVDENERELGRTRALSDIPVALRSRRLLELMMRDQAPIGTPVQVGHSRDAALKSGGWNEHRRFSHQHGDELELWIKLAAQGDAIFLPSFVAYRTIWPGGSQQRIPHQERYLSNLYIKDLIAEKLGEPTPQSIKSYLALHWALVAAKERSLSSAVRLGFEWIKRPASLVHLLNKRRLKDASQFLEEVPNDSAT